MAERLLTYAAALTAAWQGARSGIEYALESVVEGDPPVYVARGEAGTLALAIATLWEPESDPRADEGRAFMQERLSGGLVRGPFLLWVPPRAAVPRDEPDASDFTQRVQQAAAPLLPGARGEVEFEAPVQLAKMRDEGGYASVIGGLSRWWTIITERVNGTFHVNSSRIRRAPQSSAARERIFDRIAELARGMQLRDALEFEAAEAWTVQRLAAEPLGERGFAIAQAPPGIDPGDGTLMRRLVRRRLKDAAVALDAVSADAKGVGLIAIYEYAEHETVGAFVKSLDPSLYAWLNLLVALVDGEVRPIFGGRA